MFSSKKIAVAAGVLGSFALIGVGAAQAFGHEAAGMCADDGKGYVRCADVSKSKLTTDKRGNVVTDRRGNVVTDKRGNVVVVNDSTQICPASHGQVTCVDSVVVPRDTY
ncbi:hypothetical protein CLM62_03490 [Streptomyces sp. SA15]|uniref:hypothetical protein n=1 Tax=Streptomyces sp. SA15 TaxID=934019 RepID=UPI000BB0A042|nr:hypothetical protein [Streptomyces sp. SA15]PAZ17246.1 hypothetical protein CLM62_03490 [Streptomyces sp. SA15]